MQYNQNLIDNYKENRKVAREDFANNTKQV